MSGRPASDRLLTRAFVLLIGGHFLQALGYSTMLLLPLYLDHLGAMRLQIGQIMASAAVGGLLFRPLIGWGLDAVGRKPTLIAGTITLATGMSLVFFVTDIGVVAYVQRIVYGIGVGACFTGYFAFAADLIPESRRTEGLALFGVSGLLPLALNPVVRELGIAKEDLRYFFPCVALLILSSLLFLIPLKEPPRTEPKRKIRLTAAMRALSESRLLSVWLATIIFSSMVATFFAFATVVGEHRGIGRPALIWFAYAAAACVVRVGGGKLPDKVGTWNIIAPALACYGAAALLVASGWSVTTFMLAGALAGVGHGYCFPVLASQVVTRTPNYLRGSGMAMYTAVWELASLVLTPFYGSIADSFDDATMFSSLAVISTVALVVWVIAEHYLGGRRKARL